MTELREHPPPAPAPAAPTAPEQAPTRPARITGLDGIRGLAALFVVASHIFERAWPGYPSATHAPFWAAWLLYGRAAVAVFIVLSGFSLGLGPARTGWRFKSLTTYAHRRAWRILPPYWAALAFSLIMTWYVLAQPHWPVPTGKSVVVYGLLAQDAYTAHTLGSPNRAFWSIAVEAQLYFVLPLLLLLVRRISALAMVGVVAVIVVTIGLLGPHVALMNTALIKFTPDLAVLFAVGLLAAGIVTAGQRTRSRPWAGYALATAVPPIALMVVNGSVWSNLNLFWLDLAWAPAIGCFLAAIATARPRTVVRFLNSRLPRSLGSCSYSLYLTHLPIVIAISYGLVGNRVAAGAPRFFVLVLIVVPVTVGFARMFAAIFEIPFMRHRGWTPLRHAMSARLHQVRPPWLDPAPTGHVGPAAPGAATTAGSPRLALANRQPGDRPTKSS
ncbi:MAG: acyltransferase [Actinobacteria bacterium]|nr:acyltransferase [Actinomycetota bacterium]